MVFVVVFAGGGAVEEFVGGGAVVELVGGGAVVLVEVVVILLVVVF